MSQHKMTTPTNKKATTKNPKMKQRNFCITSYTTDNYQKWQQLDIKKHYIKYLVYQQEKCPTTGKEHIQGYVEFINQHTNINNIKEVFNDKTLHIEARKGTATEARDYCMKALTKIKNPIELGEFTTSGRRTDISQVYNAIKDGNTPQQIAEMYPSVYMKYYKAIDRVYNDIQSKTEGRFNDIEVNVLYGDAGTGKTRQVYDKHGIENVFRLCNSNSNNLWFDGYTGQKVLLIDDYYGWIKYGKFLQLIDNYKIRLEIKGGITYSQWDKIYITSNDHPKEWYSKGLTPAISRRIKYIDHVKMTEGQTARIPIERVITKSTDGTQTIAIKNSIDKVADIVLPATYESDPVGDGEEETDIAMYMGDEETFRKYLFQICPEALETSNEESEQEQSDNEY